MSNESANDGKVCWNDRVDAWWSERFEAPSAQWGDPIERHCPGFGFWLRQFGSPRSLQDLGVRRSADVDRTAYAVLQQGYFSGYRGRSFLFVRRDELEEQWSRYVRDLREQHNTSAVQLKGRIIKALSILTALNLGESEEGLLTLAHALASSMTARDLTKPKVLNALALRRAESVSRAVAFRDTTMSLVPGTVTVTGGAVTCTLRKTFHLGNGTFAKSLQVTVPMACVDQGAAVLASTLEDHEEVRCWVDQIKQSVRLVLDSPFRQILGSEWNKTLGRMTSKDRFCAASLNVKAVLAETLALRIRRSVEQCQVSSGERLALVMGFVRESRKKVSQSEVVLAIDIDLPETVDELRHLVSQIDSIWSWLKPFQSVRFLQMGTVSNPTLSDCFRLSVVRPGLDLLGAVEQGATLCANALDDKVDQLSMGLLEANLKGPGVWDFSLNRPPLRVGICQWKSPAIAKEDVMGVLEQASALLSAFTGSLSASKGSAERKAANSVLETARSGYRPVTVDSLDDAVGAFGRFRDFLQQVGEKRQQDLRDHEERRALQARQRDVVKNLMAHSPYHVMHRRYVGQRKVLCFLAPTNAGKSWQARQRIVSLAKGQANPGEFACLFPLRVLALENFDSFSEMGVACSLVTGEEEMRVEGANITAQTIETFDSRRAYVAVMVDEAQLTFSGERGGAYLRVLIGANTDHLILTAAPEAREALKALFDRTGDSIEFVEMDRLCPLNPIERPVRFGEVVPGDLIVAFSVAGVHEIAQRLRGARMNIGTLYGAMPPVSRREMYRAYQDGKIDVMVATDAIGLGCNMPCHRVLFSDVHKFDGVSVRGLYPSEIRQLAGRAGRFGKHETGRYGRLVWDSRWAYEDIDDDFDNDVSVITQAVSGAIEPLSSKVLWAIPDREIVFEAGLGLAVTLRLWGEAVVSHPGYRVGADMMNLMQKASFLDQLIEKKMVSRETAVDLLFVTFNERNHWFLYTSLCSLLCSGGQVPMPRQDGHGLQAMEDRAARLALVYQLARIFPDQCPSRTDIGKVQIQVGQSIARTLLQIYTGKSRKQKKAEPNGLVSSTLPVDAANRSI